MFNPSSKLFVALQGAIMDIKGNALLYYVWYAKAEGLKLSMNKSVDLMRILQ